MADEDQSVEPWVAARHRWGRAGAGAAVFHEHRPRYPAELFSQVAGLVPRGARVVEVGAGTGIATSELVSRGLRVVALELSGEMAAILRANLRDGIELVEIRFEDWEPIGEVDLVVAFNAWHWVALAAGFRHLHRVLSGGGLLALVWTRVIERGQPPFEQRLSEMEMPPLLDVVSPCLDRLRYEDWLEPMPVREFPMDQVLSADGFEAQAATYGDAILRCSKLFGGGSWRSSMIGSSNGSGPSFIASGRSTQRGSWHVP